MNKYKSYNFKIFLFVIILIASFCAINIVIDPYGIWNLWSNRSVNTFKTEQTKHERLYKAIEIVNVKPDVVFVGTSRTRIGLDPGYYSSNKHVYNAAVASANMNEMLLYFKHALQNQLELKEVIVGIDFYAFNQNLANRPDLPTKQIEKNHITFNSFIETSASLDALLSSIKTLRNNIGNNSKASSFDYNGKSSEIDLQNTYGNIVDLRGFTKINKINIGDKEAYLKYDISQDYVNDFKELIDICRERNINVKVFISPSHATDMEAIRVSGQWEKFENMKRTLCNITPVWDFSGYNSITTENITSNRQYYWDSSHYKKIVGDKILDKINGIDNSPVDFGVIITPENIDRHLKYIRKSREMWANDNNELVEFVQSLKL